jgi:hypothetical protein
VRGGRTEERLAAEQSRESLDHGGVARVMVELPEMDRFDFEKNQI